MGKSKIFDFNFDFITTSIAFLEIVSSFSNSHIFFNSLFRPLSEWLAHELQINLARSDDKFLSYSFFANLINNFSASISFFEKFINMPFSMMAFSIFLNLIFADFENSE